jgi:hypothetical protein
MSEVKGAADSGEMETDRRASARHVAMADSLISPVAKSRCGIATTARLRRFPAGWNHRGVIAHVRVIASLPRR